MGIKGDLIAVSVAGAVLLAAGWYAKKKMLPALNPADPNNVVNKTVEGWYQAATGSAGTIGGDIYDITHTGPIAETNWYEWINPFGALGHMAANAAPDAVNPASDGNLINRGVSAVGGAIAGNENWTLGGQIYDWTH